MGVRLQPQTDDKRLVEILAGVPRGTHERLDQFERDNPTDLMDQDQSYEVYKKRQQDPDIDRLHQFLLFGYGRVKYNEMKIMGFDPEGGRTRNLPEIGRILTAHLPPNDVQRIWPHLHKLDALAWC